MNLRSSNNENDEIDFGILYNLIIRLIKKNLIFFSSISLTIMGGLILYLSSLKPIFVGEYNLYFDEEINISKKFIIDFLKSFKTEKSFDLVLSTNANQIKKNEQIILSSSLEEINSINLKNGNEELSYQKFLDKIEIQNLPESNSIKIIYKNNDKELISKSLKIISNRYISYAKELNLDDLNNLNFFYKLNKSNMLRENEDFLDKKFQVINDSSVIFLGKSQIIKEQIYKEKNLLIALGLISSLFIPIVILLIKEKLIGNIYEFDLNLINCKFINRIPLSQKRISKNLLKNIFSKIEPKEFIGIIHGDSLFLENVPKLSEFIKNERKKIIDIDISNQEIINKCDHFLITLEYGNCKYNDIDLINNCMPLFQGKIIGWILFY